jgi:hypothetical protein
MRHSNKGIDTANKKFTLTELLIYHDDLLINLEKKIKVIDQEVIILI